MRGAPSTASPVPTLTGNGNKSKTPSVTDQQFIPKSGNTQKDYPEGASFHSGGPRPAPGPQSSGTPRSSAPALCQLGGAAPAPLSRPPPPWGPGQAGISVWVRSRGIWPHTRGPPRCRHSSTQATPCPVCFCLLAPVQDPKNGPRVTTADWGVSWPGPRVGWPVPKTRIECAPRNLVAHPGAVAWMSSWGRDALRPALEPPPQSPRGRVVPETASRGLSSPSTRHGACIYPTYHHHQAGTDLRPPNAPARPRGPGP